MLERFNKLKINEDWQLIFRNFFSLSFLNILNLITPLITYPYLIRILGSGEYGRIIFYQSILAFFIIFISFGFQIISTQNISKFKDDKNQLYKIVTSTYIIKLFFTIISFSIIIIYFLIAETKDSDLSLILLLSSALVYELFFPIWYFQGIEKMNFVSYFNGIPKVIQVVLIFVFIVSENDLLIYAFLLAITNIMTVILSLIKVFYIDRIQLVKLTFKEVYDYYKQSLPIFHTTVFVTINTQVSKTIIGLSLGMSQLALYDLSEKVVNILKTPFATFGQALFPKSARESFKELKKPIIIMILISIISIIFINLFSDKIVLFLGGYELLEASLYLKIMSIAILGAVISTSFSIHVLIPNGNGKDVSLIYFYTSLFYCFTLLILYGIGQLTILNFSIIFVVLELVSGLLSFIYSMKRKLIL